MIAADTYRPAAVDQLVTLAKQIKVPYYEEGTANTPPAIVRRGIKKASETGADIVLVDTAGRLQMDEMRMQELEEIKKLSSPAEILLVADAMTGQEAVNIARGFNERLGITGLVPNTSRRRCKRRRRPVHARRHRRPHQVHGHRRKSHRRYP